MFESWYEVAIAALLPLTAAMLVTQVNPYHALVIRGIVGAVAALVYALLGAADVALTEALVGTMLSITLYAIAVRSSMSLRLGILDEQATAELKAPGVNAPSLATAPSSLSPVAQPVLPAIKAALRPHHLRLELHTYPTLEALQTALRQKEIHATCVSAAQRCYWDEGPMLTAPASAPYHLHIRLQRLYDLLQSGLPSTLVSLSYTPSLALRPLTSQPSTTQLHNALEGQP
jgi:putative multicomponent Na+:H+ antiporter subunit B